MAEACFAATVEKAVEQTKTMSMKFYANNPLLAAAEIESRFMQKPAIFIGTATKTTQDSINSSPYFSELSDLIGERYEFPCYVTKDGGIWLPTKDIYLNLFNKIFLISSKDKKILVSEDPKINNYIRWLDMMNLGLPPTFPVGYSAEDFIHELQDLTECMDIVDSASFSLTTEGKRFYMSFNPMWERAKKAAEC